MQAARFEAPRPPHSLHRSVLAFGKNKTMSDARPTNQELRGVTINERLVVCGLLGRWDDAVTTRDKELMVCILLAVAMTESQAANTVDAVLQKLEAYGF
jgi:hypothetical protein